MAIAKLYKKILSETAESGVEIKICSADVRQVEAMKKAGWHSEKADAEKVTKTSLKKAAEVDEKDSDQKDSEPDSDKKDSKK